METVTKSAQETKALGEKISNSLKGGETLALTGELGSGKTTFVRGLASGLGIEQRIISPTFIILRKYNIPLVYQPKGIKNFYHIDLYRLEGAVESELKNIGAPDIWGKKQNVVAVEWAEKVTGMFPGNTVWIKFENLGGNRRKITMK
ncbi:tRNA (adenosine(37)-N6)-threonylcarbamoyltransferase complex ATPase subunit type 1 TsaE [Patescibacteria group bacterium]|nr:tRNA (adenosine(37)-N6)-threonylcarbamoyltransferase complex ATPase subunit type 1 TsaE [Patescibacteria group bacterium]